MSRIRVFISYARPTADRARAIERAFGPEFEVWIDDRLLAHRSFSDAIEEALNSAHAVIVVWSAEAARSDWVRAEASRAREMGKLVQVRVDGAQLPLPFDQIHCIDLSDWRGDVGAAPWQSVLASIAAVNRGKGHQADPGADSPSRAAVRSAPERRQVTALACRPADAHSLEPEDLMAAMETCHSLCEQIVPRHGGAIMAVHEHGVLAYFGYPFAGEETEAEAVRAALALAAAGQPLSVGVATGMVVAGAVGGGAPTVVGETPHLASKLAHVARPGSVAVDEATRRLSDDLIAYRPLDLPASREGAPESRAYEPTGAVSAAGLQGLAGPARLYGRDDELTVLADALKSAQRGAGQVVLVEGEAGIGKSALIAAFRSTTPDTPAVIWRCSPSSAGHPLRPAIEWLQHEAGFEPTDHSDARLEKLAAFAAHRGLGAGEAETLGELLGLGSGPTDPDRLRAQTLDLLHELIRGAPGAGATLLIAEDLQWADPSTLDLLDRAVRETPDRRQLVLAAARPEFRCSWFEHADVARVRLGPLPVSHAERVCTAVEGAGRLNRAVLDRILVRADGVPLYIEEITRSVVEGLDADGRSNDVHPQVPSSLQGSLTSRLDRLGPAKAVARIGAAIGRTFSYELIEAVADLPSPDLRQALRDLVRAGLLDCAGVPPASRYVFRHGLICDAAYEMLPRRQREALHRRIAQVLSGATADLPVDPGLVAEHLSRAGDMAAATPLWAAAGQLAAAKAAHGEAVHYLEQALAALRGGPRAPQDVGLELQLLIGLAVSAAATRGYTAREVGKALMEARAICTALGDGADLFPVLRGICAFMIMSGDMDAAEQLARRCRDIGLETGRPEHRIEGECPLGYVLWCKGELDAARGHLEAAVALYREHDGARLPPLTPQDPLVQSLGPLQVICHHQGDTAAAERASQELIAHAETLGVSISHAFGLFWRGFHAQLCGDFATALEYAGAASAQCQAHGYSALALQAEVTRIFAKASLGDASAGLAEAAPVMAEIERRGEVHALAFKLGEIANLHAACGDAPAALASLDAALAAAEQTGERFWLPRLRSRQAEIRAHSAEHASA